MLSALTRLVMQIEYTEYNAKHYINAVPLLEARIRICCFNIYTTTLFQKLNSQSHLSAATAGAGSARAIRGGLFLGALSAPGR